MYIINGYGSWNYCTSKLMSSLNVRLTKEVHAICWFRYICWQFCRWTGVVVLIIARAIFWLQLTNITINSWEHYPAFSSVDESIHRESTDKARPFVGSRVPVMLPRIKITVREGPSECSAQITNWVTKKLGGFAWSFALPCTVMTPSLSWGARMHVFHVRYSLWTITAVIISKHIEVSIMSNPPSPSRSMCGVNVPTTWHCLWPYPRQQLSYCALIMFPSIISTP